MMWEQILDIITATPAWELLLIFFSKIIEVSIGTTRIILINKGYRKQGVILSFIEIILWTFIASRVITNINEEPFKGIVYSLGFAAGVYAGSRLENFLGFGRVLIQAITTVEMGGIITDSLRTEGYGVTTINAHGKDNDKLVLMVYTNRKGKEKVINRIIGIDEKAMLVSNDVTTLQGGYFSPWRRVMK